MSKKYIVILVILVVLILDQWLKIYIKTNFMLGQERHILGNWFILHFVENKGMAFGFEFGMKHGKPILTIFRMIAATAIGIYLFKIIKQGIPTGLAISVALILAGAVGNIIDSAIYGLIFDGSYSNLATLFPEGGGYGKLLHGAVVDMFYFPLIKTTWPSWSPINAGESFIFFRPVFNIADSAITIGISIILIFYRSFFSELDKKAKVEEETGEK